MDLSHERLCAEIKNSSFFFWVKYEKIVLKLSWITTEKKFYEEEEEEKID